MPLVTTLIPQGGDELQVFPVGKREKTLIKEEHEVFSPSHLLIPLFLFLEAPTSVCPYT